MSDSTFTWGTLTALAPLRVQLDGDTAALPFTPETLTDPLTLAVGSRVRCELSNNRVIIHGRSGGISFRRNRCIDGAFVINQANYASGQHLPHGQYGHDMWKAPAWNMIGNGSFEANLGGWLVEASSSITRVTSGGLFGSCAMRLQINTAGNTVHTAYMPVFTVLGRRYTFSAYVKASSGARTVSLLPSGFTEGAAVVVNATWQRISVSFIGNGAFVNMLIYPRSTGASGDAVLIDGVMMTEGELLWPYMDGSQQPVYNMASNPSFEQRGLQSPTWGWSQYNCLSYLDTSWAASGTNSIRLEGNGATDSYLMLDPLPGTVMHSGFVAGQTYTVSATANISAPLGGSAYGSGRERAIVLFHNGGGSLAQVAASAQAPNVAGTTRLSLTFTIPVGTTNAFIRFYLGHTVGSIRWDAVQIETGSTANPYTENSYSFTQQPQGQAITLFPGAYIQTIHERANIPAGTYVASHAGTAPHRVYNVGSTPPAFATGPIVVTLDGTDHVVHEFYGDPATTRTVELVQLELGVAATPFERRLVSEVLAACYRYYRRWQGTNGTGVFQRITPYGQQTSTTAFEVMLSLGVSLRAAPCVSWAQSVGVYWSDDVTYNQYITALSYAAGNSVENAFDLITLRGSMAAVGTTHWPGSLVSAGLSSYFDLDARLR